MAQPPFVPQSPRASRDFYESPGRTRGAWKLERPGDSTELAATNGNIQGPNQGYALLLAQQFADRIELPSDSPLSVETVLRGCVYVALRRASLVGRAPTASDIEIGLLIWGFVANPEGGAGVSEQVVKLRRSLFGDLEHNPHRIAQIANLCPPSKLKQPVKQIRQQLAADPLALFDATELENL